MSVIKAANRPEFSWKTIRVGDDLGLVSGVVTEDAVRAHAFSLGDDPNRYLDHFGGPIVPPTLISNELLKLFFLGYEFPPPFGAGLHTRSQIHYRTPIPIGEQIQLKGTHISKYVRRGRRHRVLHGEAVLGDGTVAVEMTATETVGYDVHDEPDCGDPPNDWAAHLPRAEPSSTDGEKFGPYRRRISYEQSVLFSGFPFSWAHDSPEPMRSGTHTNAENAEAAGYGMPIVQGLLPASHLTVLLLDRFGDRALHDSKLSFVFVAPVFVRSDIWVTCAEQASVREPTNKFHAAILFATNEAGKVATAGHARVPQ